MDFYLFIASLVIALIGYSVTDQPWFVIAWLVLWTGYALGLRSSKR